MVVAFKQVRKDHTSPGMANEFAVSETVAFIDRGLEASKPKNNRVSSAATQPTIDEFERGDEEESNQSVEFGASLAHLDRQRAITKRAAIARKLGDLAQKLIDARGTIERMADLRVLRRELARRMGQFAS